MAKFCGKCGSQQADDAVFCDSCGSRVDEFSEETVEVSGGQETVKQKNRKPLIIGAAAAIVAVIAIVIAASGSKTLKLNKYIDIVVDGYDGYGVAHAEFDSDAFVDAYEKIAKIPDLDLVEELERACRNDGTLDPGMRLSNGDTVTYQWNIDRSALELQYGVELKYDDVETKVEGLDAVEDFDPFDYLTVSYEGTDGYGRAMLETAGGADTPEYAGLLTFTAEQTEGLSNGDSITVTAGYLNSEYGANMTEYYGQCYGVVPTEVEKTYTVEGLGEGEAFDPFEFVSVEFDGLSPNGTVTVQIDPSDPRMENAAASVEHYENLTNGDEITVSLGMDWSGDSGELEELWRQEGYTVDSMTKTYTVEGLSAYVSELSQISEDALERMKQQAEDAITAQTAQSWTHSSLTGTEYQGAVLLAPKSEEFQTSYHNMVYLVYTVSGMDEDTNEPFFYYHFMRYTDLLYGPEGECEVDLSDYLYSSKEYESMKAFLSDCVHSQVDTYAYETDIEE